MAISEICKFETKSQIDHLVTTKGLSRNEASKQVAGWFTEILGREIKPETIRKKDQRARVGTDVPNNERPKCQQCDQGVVIESPKTGKPMEHGLCRKCRAEELADEREWKAKEKYEQTPIDPGSEHYWNETTEKIYSLLMECAGVICGKVGKEALTKIYIVRGGLIQLQDRIETVIEKSTYRSKSGERQC